MLMILEAYMNAETMERILEIPQDRWISFQVPEEVPIGPVEVFISFRPLHKEQKSTISDRW
jgi:hypothetical protein